MSARLTPRDSTAIPAPVRPSRRPGRPPVDVTLDDVVDAAERLVLAHGLPGASVARVASELGVARTTLYRLVPSRERLLGLALGRVTERLWREALGARDDPESAGERLRRLVTLHVRTAVEARAFFSMLFDEAGTPAGIDHEWRAWRRDYEALWVGVVTDAQATNALPGRDPEVTTRLILGMCIWVSRWYRPDHQLDADEIAAIANELILSSITSTNEGATA